MTLIILLQCNVLLGKTGHSCRAGTVLMAMQSPMAVALPVGWCPPLKCKKLPRNGPDGPWQRAQAVDPQIPKIPIWLTAVECVRTSPNYRGPTTQPTEPKESAAWFSYAFRGLVSMPQWVRTKSNPPWGFHRLDTFQNNPRMLDQIRVGTRSWSWALTFLNPFLSSFSCVVGFIALLRGVLPSGGVPPTQKQMETMSIPCECGDPRFPSRTSECNEMVIGFHITCQ